MTFPESDYNTTKTITSKQVLSPTQRRRRRKRDKKERAYCWPDR